MAEQALTRKLNLFGILDELDIMRMGNKDVFPYDGIYCFTGFQGSGKTLNLIHTLYYMHEKYPNALIVSNIHLNNLDYIPYTGLECFDLSNGDEGIIYVIDEIQTLYCSLESKNMPVESLTVWCQNRKNRRVILSSSQRFNRVAKAIREQCKYHIECKPRFLFFYRYRVIDAFLYDENGELPSDYKPPFYSWYVPQWWSFFSYNTKEVVDRSKK